MRLAAFRRGKGVTSGQLGAEFLSGVVDLVQLVEGHARMEGRALTLSAEQVGAAVMVLGDGLAVQRLEAFEAIPESLLGTLLDVLIPALTRDE